MKARSFEYVRGRSRAQVLDLLAIHGDEARILAGGQSLMPLLNMRMTSPTILIDINRIEDLAGISHASEMVTIGAMTRHFEVADSPIIARNLPLITAAMTHVAHPAIRNRGTFGGSIALADPAGEMPACCVALDARMVLESVRGRREVPASSFFKGLSETALASDEILTEVQFPLQVSPWRFGFLEVSRRRGDYAIIGTAWQADVRERQIHDIRVVFLGAADRPVRASEAERAFLAARSFRNGLADAQDAIERDLPLWSDAQATSEMRHHLARVLLGRATSSLTADLD